MRPELVHLKLVFKRLHAAYAARLKNPVMRLTGSGPNWRSLIVFLVYFRHLEVTDAGDENGLLRLPALFAHVFAGRP